MGYVVLGSTNTTYMMLVVHRSRIMIILGTATPLGSDVDFASLISYLLFSNAIGFS